MKIYNFLNIDLDFDQLWQKMVEEYKFWNKKCSCESSATFVGQKDGIIGVQSAKQESDAKQF